MRPYPPHLDAFVQLGTFLSNFGKSDTITSDPWTAKLKATIERASIENKWFTEENVLHALWYWGNVLTEENIQLWLLPYSSSPNPLPKRIAVIMAGNIPLVGFHDFLSVVLSGNKIVVKLSSNDKHLLPFIAEFLIAQDPSLREWISFTEEQLKDFDAVIATGSNNTGRYFEYYFNQYPNIIRKNRNSIAVLSGKESPETLAQLGEDIFRYFGLGCRSVSKLYVPKGYDFEPLFHAISHWEPILQNQKYANNYDYNKAVYLMSDAQLLDNGFLLLKQDEKLSSPVGTLFYEYYEEVAEIKELIGKESENIQCVVAEDLLSNAIAPGHTQRPQLRDYADAVDTVAFLTQLE